MSNRFNVFKFCILCVCVEGVENTKLTLFTHIRFLMRIMYDNIICRTYEHSNEVETCLLSANEHGTFFLNWWVAGKRRPMQIHSTTTQTTTTTVTR